jgi:uncharacterized protein YbjT (DUF2867 family)
MEETRRSVVMIGATGAVGGHAARTLAARPDLVRLTLLGRRPAPIEGPAVAQHTVDVLDPQTFRQLLPGHDSALCTVGVGEPSKMSREEFLRIDRDAPLAFAKACREAGVAHFALLGSVGANARSRSFYLRTKGELEEGLRALGFPRLSLFRPSMILTPENRYGFTQAVTLLVWPLLGHLFFGPLRPLRGVRVEQLGRAMALQLFTEGGGAEVVTWERFQALTR